MKHSLELLIAAALGLLCFLAVLGLGDILREIARADADATASRAEARLVEKLLEERHWHHNTRPAPNDELAEELTARHGPPTPE